MVSKIGVSFTDNYDNSNNNKRTTQEQKTLNPIFEFNQENPVKPVTTGDESAYKQVQNHIMQNGKAVKLADGTQVYNLDGTYYQTDKEGKPLMPPRTLTEEQVQKHNNNKSFQDYVSNARQRFDDYRNRTQRSFENFRQQSIQRFNNFANGSDSVQDNNSEQLGNSSAEELRNPESWTEVRAQAPVKPVTTGPSNDPIYDRAVKGLDESSNKPVEEVPQGDNEKSNVPNLVNYLNVDEATKKSLLVDPNFNKINNEYISAMAEQINIEEQIEKAQTDLENLRASGSRSEISAKENEIKMLQMDKKRADYAVNTKEKEAISYAKSIADWQDDIVSDVNVNGHYTQMKTVTLDNGQKAYQDLQTGKYYSLKGIYISDNNNTSLIPDLENPIDYKDK